MPLITITSDLGIKDNYVALVKAGVLSSIEGASIIDISHDIEKFNLTNAAYIFGNAYNFFPAGTVHLVGVKSQQPAKRLLYIEIDNQKIICLDNGFITLLPDIHRAKIFYFEGKEFEAGLFFLKDAMVKALQAILTNPEAVKPCTDFVQLMQFQPTVTPQSIIGRCLHIDDFGNVVTNITKIFFEAESAGRKFSINLPGVEIDRIVNDYDDVSANTALALFNTFGYLEIAINREKASKLLFPKSMHTNTDFNISIQFED
ncbi:MAG TPA: SAM-dependent chlorinase/fluorinase [Bacteroidia bacterium]|nr:SAM-dependent chlorinase/fluorinase [Bacteroidia bacterium]